ncbi:unnamed protein product [Victoria cruziana]
MDLPVPIHDILLVSIGSGLTVGGLGVVLLTNPIYSAFSLGLVLVCISLFYILSNSYFVAAIILQLFLFLDYRRWIYFTSLYEYFFSLIATIPNTPWYGIIWTTRSNQVIEQDLTSNVQQIGIHLSTDFYLPFELIFIILLVSLVGAIAMAHRE